MTESQLSAGIALAKAGQNAEARKLLTKVVQCDPNSVLGWLWLAGVVETVKQRCDCLEKVLQLNPENQVVQRALEQAKAARSQQTGLQYYVGRSLTSEQARQCRDAVLSAFGEGYEPCHVNTTVTTGEQSLLFQACQKILLSSFGVFDLSSADPDCYIELGIALGLNRPIVVTVRAGTALPMWLEEHRLVQYTAPSDLAFRLSQLREQGFPPTLRPSPDHCHFCNCTCEGMATPPDETAYLVLNESKLLWRGLMKSLTPHLSQYHLRPVYLSDQSSGPALCGMRRNVLASRFVICHLGALSNEASFLALGMAIGSRVPWMLLSRQNGDPVPSLLQGFDRVVYTTLADLCEGLTDALAPVLGKSILPSISQPAGTTMISLPFWVQLDDWISRVKHAARAPEAIRGTIRLFQYEGQNQVAESVIPSKGVLIGRDVACDIVIETPSVSARHLRILEGRNGKYFVQDLDSKNGTFLNGSRLPPGKMVEIRPNDTIRIPGVRFLVWDDRPLPQDKVAPILADTDELPPILRIDIPDISPPSYLSTWDHSLTLTISLPNSHKPSICEVQAYYPMGKIISKLVDILRLPAKKYGFMVDGQPIGDDETPLSAGVRKTDVLVMVPQESQTDNPFIVR
ncbi:MAG TPA: FHA domain-containing protein [Chloroflexi bacterium]|nr:FHA domain-containing protein [Chloroflexota bacterium]